MSHFGLKILKTQRPDKTPYTIYYPHNIASTERKWTQPYYQVVSIDPARKNYAFRIERRYHNGWIIPIVFDKAHVESIEEEGGTTICNTYEVLTNFLDKYKQFYDECHFIIIERQLPQNYKATRIEQHSISYFSLLLKNKPLLPSIVEVDSKLKGKILGAPKGINDQQLKRWATEKARELLNIRLDRFSIGVLDHFRTKQDDLSDTVCQVEAIFIVWGFLPTIPPPISGPDNTPQQIKPITLRLTPSIVVSSFDNIHKNLPKLSSSAGATAAQIKQTPNMIDILSASDVTPSSMIVQRNKILTLVQAAPERVPVSKPLTLTITG